MEYWDNFANMLGVEVNQNRVFVPKPNVLFLYLGLPVILAF